MNTKCAIVILVLVMIEHINGRPGPSGPGSQPGGPPVGPLPPVGNGYGPLPPVGNGYGPIGAPTSSCSYNCDTDLYTCQQACSNSICLNDCLYYRDLCLHTCAQLWKIENVRNTGSETGETARDGHSDEIKGSSSDNQEDVSINSGEDEEASKESVEINNHINVRNNSQSEENSNESGLSVDNRNNSNETLNSQSEEITSESQESVPSGPVGGSYGGSIYGPAPPAGPSSSTSSCSYNCENQQRHCSGNCLESDCVYWCRYDYEMCLHTCAQLWKMENARNTGSETGWPAGRPGGGPVGPIGPVGPGGPWGK